MPTQMIYTTSLRQINYIASWMAKYINNSDNKLITMIEMLASQSVIYDKLLNNIAQFGNPELIKKCSEDIKSVFSGNEK